MTRHLLILLAAAGAAALDLGGRDKYSDPDMVTEMTKAQNSNLENAMRRGRAEALKSVENLRLLMLGTRGVVQGALADVRGVVARKSAAAVGSLEDAAERLRLSDQVLADKGRDVLGRARIADLPPGEREPEQLRSERARYSGEDRAADLKAAAKYLKMGRKKYRQPKGVLLTEAQDNLLGASFAYARALAEAEGRLKSLRDQLKRKHRKLGASAYVERLDARLDQLERDRKAFDVERELLDAHIRLMVLDEIAFDIVTE